MRRIVLDQGLPAATAEILRSDGWDAVHVRELDMKEAEDGETTLSANPEWLITLDRDFPQILVLTGAIRPSVVFIRQQRLHAAELASLLVSHTQS